MQPLNHRVPSRPTKADPTATATAAGVLAWFLPGAGHWYLGQRRFAMMYFIAVTIPYLAGVAIGGVKTTVNPHLNHWLFLAELGVGSYASGFYLMNGMVGPYNAPDTADILMRSPRLQMDPRFNTITKRDAAEAALHPYQSYYPGSEVAQIYVAVAGLLNILAVLDAITRAAHGGRPVFSREWTSGGGS